MGRGPSGSGVASTVGLKGIESVPVEAETGADPVEVAWYVPAAAEPETRDDSSALVLAEVASPLDQGGDLLMIEIVPPLDKGKGVVMSRGGWEVRLTYER